MDLYQTELFMDFKKAFDKVLSQAYEICYCGIGRNIWS